MTLVLLYSLYPSHADATKAAQHLLEQRLVACCNLVPGVTSFYWWDGALTESAEVQLWCKTTPNLADAAIEALRCTHPYRCPAILRLNAEATTEYARWAAEATTT